MWKVIVWVKRGYRWEKATEKHYKREASLLRYVWAQERVIEMWNLKTMVVVYGRVE